MRNLRHYPLVWAELLYCLLFVAEMTLSLSSSGHKLVYPLDDTYISMAIGKHFAEHGVWGVTPFRFASSSSTPLFVLLIAAADWIAGTRDWLPLALAFVSGAGAIWAAYRMLPEAGSKHRMTALLAVVMLTPLATMAHLGMEHPLHIWLTLVFAWRASTAISEKRRADWVLVCLAPLLVMTRFEGLFLVGISALLLSMRRSFLLAGGIVATAAAPVIGYGLLGLSQGWFFLPNSILLKGAKIGPSFLLSLIAILCRPFFVLRIAPHLIGILDTLLLVSWATRKGERWAQGKVLLWLALLSVIAHITLADVGWIFRYEAYLIAFSVIGIAAALPLISSAPARKAAYALSAMAGAILLVRSVDIFAQMPSITEGIYSQQYQMARFVALHYPSASIAANDIGAINYMSDLRLVDLVGLADPEILRFKRRKAYTTNVIEQEASKGGVDIAIVYDDWFSDQHPAVFGGPSLPREWVRIGRWHTSKSEHLGGATVSFYAVQRGEEARLRENFNTFTAALPSEVTVLRN